MSRTKASLPDSSRIGFSVLILSICFLLAMNSIATNIAFSIFHRRIPSLDDARIGQPILFALPLVLLAVELAFFAGLGRMMKRKNGDS